MVIPWCQSNTYIYICKRDCIVFMLVCAVCPIDSCVPLLCCPPRCPCHWTELCCQCPPSNETERYNYCWGVAAHMWRKQAEGNLPRLAGAAEYKHQVPLHRASPLWGGISQDGFAPVLWHPNKKTNQVEWSQAVRDGKVTEALRFAAANSTGIPGPGIAANGTHS